MTPRTETTGGTSCLSRQNREKLMRVLFDNSDGTSYWQELESRVRSEVESLERFFNRAASTNSSLSSSSTLASRQVYVHEWSPFFVGEPILVKNLLDAEPYTVTNADLIRAARDSFSELTIHFLLNRVDSFAESRHSLLMPEAVGDGNFMEHLFVRMVREKQRESRFALRRLFLDALVNKDARMTCSRTLLDLFLNEDQVKNLTFYQKNTSAQNHL